MARFELDLLCAEVEPRLTKRVGDLLVLIEHHAKSHLPGERWDPAQAKCYHELARDLQKAWAALPRERMVNTLIERAVARHAKAALAAVAESTVTPSDINQ
jgi:hypothetical protein